MLALLGLRTCAASGKRSVRRATSVAWVLRKTTRVSSARGTGDATASARANRRHAVSLCGDLAFVPEHGGATHGPQLFVAWHARPHCR